MFGPNIFALSSFSVTLVNRATINSLDEKINAKKKEPHVDLRTAGKNLKIRIMYNFSILQRKGIKTWKSVFHAIRQNLVKNVNSILTQGQPNLPKRRPILQMQLRGRTTKCLTTDKR